MPSHARLLPLLLSSLLLFSPQISLAQYFGQNIVRYEPFDYQILRTEHFDIYYYQDGAEHIELVGQMAERWYERLSGLLGHELTRRQPLIFYASHPHFRQTNTSMGGIGEGTGGFTEIFRNRIVMPYAGSLAETDHVLGHELVHAFQFDMTGRRADPDRFGNIPGAIRMPLWIAEGMAEYLSVGPYDSQSAMWLRDMALRDEAVNPRRLAGRFQPYRQGHALMAYIGGRFGDEALGRLLVESAAGANIELGFRYALNISLEQLLQDWEAELRAHYEPLLAEAQSGEALGRTLASAKDRRDLPRLHLAPALSPDGRSLVYLGQRQRLSLELFLMDVRSGKNLRRISRTATDPHFEALQFVSSAGSWSPNGRDFVYSSIRKGKPALEIIDGRNGRSRSVHEFDTLDEIFNPSWSPDGQRIVFSGMRQGFTDLYVFSLGSGQLQRISQDLYSSLHPIFSADGNSLIYVTDRFDVQGRQLPANSTAAAIPTRGIPQLARLQLDSGHIEALPNVPGYKQVNPQLSRQGDAIYYLSDIRGTSNIYRLDLESGAIVELTNVQTGISGLTKLSPALSVAGPNDSMAFTLFSNGGYALMLIEDGAAMAGTPVTEIAIDPSWALLPPLERPQQLINDYLQAPALEQLAREHLSREKYRPSLRPEFISQADIAVGTGSFGGFGSGGITMYWSDMLGNHRAVSHLNLTYIEGQDASNTTVLLGYQNLSRRFNWGLVASQVPYVSGRYAEGADLIANEYYRIADIYWTTDRSFGSGVAYPLNRATRIELNADYRHISFDGRRYVDVFDLISGVYLGRFETSLPTMDSIGMTSANTALVYDTTTFGATSPILGQRARFQVGAATGDLDYSTQLVDLRGYLLPFETLPISFAARTLYYAQVGRDGENDLLGALYLGNPSLVRGYGLTYRLIGNPEFDRLQGTRMGLLNLEVRAPLTGPMGLISNLGFPLDVNLFADTGAAWNRGENPKFFGGDRTSVLSYGAGLRTNLGGLVLALHYVRPYDLDYRDWHWQFSITPGF